MMTVGDCVAPLTVGDWVPNTGFYYPMQPLPPTHYYYHFCTPCCCHVAAPERSKAEEERDDLVTAMMDIADAFPGSPAAKIAERALGKCGIAHPKVTPDAPAP